MSNRNALYRRSMELHEEEENMDRTLASNAVLEALNRMGSRRGRVGGDISLKVIQALMI